MVEEEVAKLLAVLAAAYPNFEVNEMKHKVWFEMLKDIDYKVAQVAVRKIILENTFPPAIAEVRKACAELTMPQIPDAGMAWGEAVRAIRYYGIYREKEALRSMSPLTAQAVRYIGWQEICSSTEPGVARGHFLRIYEQLARRKQQDAMLPADLKEGIAQLAQKFELRAIEGGKSD